MSAQKRAQGSGERRERPTPIPRAGFVNPFTFVPLPEIPADSPDFRRPPSGHAHLAADRYSGRIDVELTALGPLLLRGIRPSEAGTFPRRTFPSPDGDATREAEPEPFLPGSSLAGTVRSLFETLAGGCLRVFDEDHLPGYRDTAKGRGRDWKLAVVGPSDEDGRPQSMRLCDRVVWANAEHLSKVLGGADKLVTGATVDVTGEPTWHKFFNRHQVEEREKLHPGDGWVVLVTDSTIRENNPKTCHTYWCALGRLPSEGTKQGTVREEAWTRYLTAVEGTDDVRRARADKREAQQGAGQDGANPLNPGRAVPAEVRWWKKGKKEEEENKPIGHRHEARPRLYPGQVVWAKATADSKITEIALSYIWRHAGAHPPRDRVPVALLPCTGEHARIPGERTGKAGKNGKKGKNGKSREPAPEGGQDGHPGERGGEFVLCPACRVFGSADTSGADTPEARQRSYRGHVRFGDARPLGPTSLLTFRLAPLGAPKPGAGQFYLVNDEVTARERRPLGEWGSPTDRPQPRRLAGRKAYWLTARREERPYFRAHEGQWEGELAQTAEALDAGARFAFSVYVDGLSAAELGGLLVALEPRRLGQLLEIVEETEREDPVGVAVGGGKPLGFGTCATRVTAFEISGPAARYTDTSEEKPPSEDDAMLAFLDATPAEVRAVWGAAYAALTVDRVEPGTVWYPPEQPFPATGSLHVDQLAPGFQAFWQLTQGELLKWSQRDLVPLPPVTAEEQRLPIFRPDKEAGKKDGKKTGRKTDRKKEAE